MMRAGVRSVLAAVAISLAAGAAGSAIPLDEADELTSPAAILAQAEHSLARGDAAGAQSSFVRCISAAREQNDRSDLALCEAGLAQADAAPQLRQHAAAVMAAHSALALIDDRIPDDAAFQTLTQAASVLRLERDPGSAIAAYQRALQRVSGGGHTLDFYRQGIAEDGIAGCYLDLRRYSIAQVYADRGAALMLKEPQHRDTEELAVLQDAGEVNWGLHRYTAAKVRFDQALALANGDLHAQPGDSDRVARIVQRAQYGAGDTALQLGLPLKAGLFLAPCISSPADARFAAMCGIDSAEAAQQRDDDAAAQRAIEQVRSAIDVLDPADKIAYYADASLAALDSGDLQAAQTDANAALADARAGGDPFDAGRAYYAAAFVEHFLGRKEQGDALSRLAAKSWSAISADAIARYSRFGAAADTYALQTQVYRNAATSPAKARAAAVVAEEDARSDRANGALRKAEIDAATAAELRLRSRDLSAALRDAEMGYGGGRSAGDWRGIWITSQTLSRVEEARRDDAAAAQTCAAGISALEVKRAQLEGLASEEPGASIGDIDLAQNDLADAYDRCIALQFRSSGNAQESLQIFDGEQGRMILQHFRSAGAERIVGISDSDRHELAKRQMTLAAAETALANAQGDAGAVQDAQQARRDLDAFVANLQARYPAYAFVDEPQRFRNLQAWQAALRPHEAMLVYDLQERDVYAWLVSRDRVRSLRLGSLAEIQRKIDAYEKLMRSLADRQDYVAALRKESTRRHIDALAAALGGELFPNAWHGLLQGYTHLYIVPTGSLYRIPFAALRVGGSYAIEHWSLSTISSPSLLAVIRGAEQRAPEAPRELLAFASPLVTGEDSSLRGNAAIASLGPLPTAGEEAKDAESLVGASQSAVFANAEMTKDRLLELDRSGDLERYRYVLFATHAIVPAQDDGVRQPLIVFSHPNLATGDNVLSSADIAGLHMDARLVVLSACQTAYTLERHNEGEAEFAQAFFAAGSRAQAMTLWPIYDDVAADATKMLFTRLAAGDAPDEALRAMQLAMLKADGEAIPAYAANPYVWGAYVLFGDGL